MGNPDQPYGSSEFGNSRQLPTLSRSRSTPKGIRGNDEWSSDVLDQLQQRSPSGYKGAKPLPGSRPRVLAAAKFHSDASPRDEAGSSSGRGMLRRSNSNSSIRSGTKDSRDDPRRQGGRMVLHQEDEAVQEEQPQQSRRSSNLKKSPKSGPLQEEQTSRRSPTQSMDDPSEEAIPPPNQPVMSTLTLINLTPRTHSDKAWEAFLRMATDGGLELPQVILALASMGHRETRGAWVSEICEKALGGRSFLDKEDFIVCAEKYRERFKESFKTDLLSSPSSRRCLARLRTSLDPTAVATGQADLGEFLQVRDTLADYNGLTPSEYRKVLAAFRKYDEDNDGILNTQEFSGVLFWLGAGSQDVKAAVARLGGKSSLKEVDVVESMKTFFELGEEQLSDHFKATDTSKRGTIATADLETFFTKVGHPAITPDVIGEVLEATGLSKRTKLTFDEACRIVMKFRERRGFTLAELDEVAKSFEVLDVDGSGSLDAPELEVAVRWLGYPATFAAVRDLLDEYDMDESGELEKEEFGAFMATFRDQDAANIRKTFALHVSGDQETMPMESLGKALLFTCSQLPTPEQLAAAKASVQDGDKIGFWQFVKCVDQVRAAHREQIRKNHCFTDSEVMRYRDMFARYDPEKSGLISNSFLAALLQELFPGARENQDDHKRARALLGKVDEDGNGRVDFEEFLYMMRLYRYSSAAEELRQERLAASKTCFSSEEVKEFRQLFNCFDSDGSGSLDLDELVPILTNLSGGDADQEESSTVRQLWKLIREADDDGSAELDFPEFLRFMQKVLDKDGTGGGQGGGSGGGRGGGGVTTHKWALGG